MYLLNKSLSNASDEALRKSYNAICEEYRRRFCEKFGYPVSRWLYGEIGVILVAGSELFVMSRIMEIRNTESK